MCVCVCVLDIMAPSYLRYNILIFLNVKFEPNPYTSSQVESYLPTPPLGQDITQGQFLSGV